MQIGVTPKFDASGAYVGLARVIGAEKKSEDTYLAKFR